MSKERYKTKGAVFLIAEYQGKILCQKRQNTGYMDGYIDLGVSGHVEEGEPLTQAMLREAKEEANLCLDSKKLKLVTTIHIQHNGEVYYYFYFAIHLVATDIECLKINEPQKNSGFVWVDKNHLPEKFLFYNQVALFNMQEAISLSEIGW